MAVVRELRMLQRAILINAFHTASKMCERCLNANGQQIQKLHNERLRELDALWLVNR